jgi:SAM-dependent methyltransferase
MTLRKKITTVRLQKITKGFWESSALMSAVELGVFTAIASGANDIASIADRIKIEPLNAERLLVALTAMELVARDGDSFTNAPDVERFLVEDKPSYAGPWMLFGKPRWDGWGSLTERLREPSSSWPRLGMYEGTFDETRARTYHAATYSIGMGAARWFHKQVDLSGRKRMMDIGGGSGCYCIVGATQHGDLNAVVLDLPAVVPVTREFIAEHNLSSRVQAEICDFTADPFPTDCDVAVMASNLPQYGREMVAAVVKKVYDALEPGGEFHLIGEMLNAEGTGPHAPAMWGLSEAVSRSHGLAHTEPECIDYLKDAGFKNITATEFIPETLTRVSGSK